jgi:hypothetical protein
MIKPDMRICKQKIIDKYSDYLRNAQLFLGEFDFLKRIHYYDLPNLKPNYDYNDFGSILHNLYDGTYECFSDEKSYNTYYSSLHDICEDVIFQEAEKLNIPEDVDEDERDYLLEELSEYVDDIVCDIIDDIMNKYFTNDIVKIILMEKHPFILGV